MSDVIRASNYLGDLRHICECILDDATEGDADTVVVHRNLLGELRQALRSSIETPEQRYVEIGELVLIDELDGNDHPLIFAQWNPKRDQLPAGTKIYAQELKAAAETLRVGASDWEEFGLAVRTVSQNCEMTDLARRGDWLQRELKARGFDIVRSSQKAKLGETFPDTLVRWVSSDTWRCHCKGPGAINHSIVGVCTDCGTLRPEKAAPRRIEKCFPDCVDDCVCDRYPEVPAQSEGDQRE